MRLSSSQIYQQGVNAILNKQSELAKTQLQLATGKRVLAPSDDPTASTRIIDLNLAIETNTQYQRNADFAETRLSIEETVLTDVGNILQRVRELSVRANNDTLSAGDRQAIAEEIKTNLSAVFQLANNQDATGEYLFAGYKTDTVPFTDDGSGNYVYQGDQGSRNLQVGVNRQVSVGDAGNDVFMKIDDGAGGTINMFEMLNGIVTDLEANNPSAIALTQLDSALDVVLNTRSKIGARMNTIEAQRNANDSFSLILQENRSSLEDLDYAEAISRFEQQILALQASQQSFVKIEGLSLFNFL
jgi:flagellar hook-associated protein 3 FlgL